MRRQHLQAANVHNQPCPFCPPTQHAVVRADELAIAVRDGFPLTRGHTLLIPRRHVSSFFELTSDERQAILELIDFAKELADREFSPDGYNIGINDGTAAGQTIMHLHVHLIPRYAGDVSDPRGGVRWVIPHKAAYWQNDERRSGSR